MIYIYAESNQKSNSKNTLELLSYAKQISKINNQQINVITINSQASLEELYNYGANNIIHLTSNNLDFDVKAYSEVILNQIKDISFLLLPQNNDGLSIAGFISAKLKTTPITNIVEVPSSLEPFTVVRKVFSGKATEKIKSNNSIIVATINPGISKIEENITQGQIKTIEIEINSSTKILNTEIANTKVNLKDAEIVISGGRGLKGPENWNLIEDLANTLNAATACSKPVSDSGWRPHSEHVGQTGKAISPKLYIAVGISGAIQHLAGVNSSKTIVVINNDPEAPFFKSADYGIIGDAFDILPKLNKLLTKN